MYLFSRRARLSGGKLSESMAWATSMTERVVQATGMQVSLWTQTFSPAVGTISWSTFVPDLATLEAANDKLMADNAYHELVDRGTEFVIPGSVDDSLGMVVHGAPDPNRRAEYVGVVRSTGAAGKLARGISLGVEIAQRVEQITGLPTLFLAGTTGNYGGVAWVTAFADVAELERAQMALNMDESFVELIDREAPGVYTDEPGATTQVILRRIV